MSASAHAADLTSYGGYTRFHGTVAVRGRATPAATAMLAHLAPVADRTLRVFVAYTQTEGNAFWRELRDKRLGRRCAREVLRPEVDHRGWFDIQLGNPDDLPPVARSSCWPVIK